MSIEISHRRAKDAIQKLPALCIKVEATLAKYNQFLKQLLVSDLTPHIADHPTPLLSSLAPNTSLQRNSIFIIPIVLLHK
ncbi:hypothetical protein L0F63_006081, partial [Massospora cicadina]